MGSYPRTARGARIKCITCNAPVVRTVENEFVCVNCGGSPVVSVRSSPVKLERD